MQFDIIAVRSLVLESVSKCVAHIDYYTDARENRFIEQPSQKRLDPQRERTQTRPIAKGVTIEETVHRNIHETCSGEEFPDRFF
jgi:hypothetical protein